MGAQGSIYNNDSRVSQLVTFVYYDCVSTKRRMVYIEDTCTTTTNDKRQMVAKIQ